MRWGSVHRRRFYSLAGILVLAVVMSFSVWGSGLAGRAVAQAGSCSDVIVNGDFESEGGWDEYSAQGLHLISTFPPPSQSYHSGTHGAYLADYNNAHDRISQSVTIPVDAVSATLTYWWQVDTEESSDLARDVMSVTLDSSLGTPIAVLHVYSNLDAGAVWHQEDIDVSAYKGQTLILRFDARTDASLPTGFFVDDVALVVCESSSTPTPTPTPVTRRPWGYLPLLWR